MATTSISWWMSANYSLTYSLCGHLNHMSPDDHFQDLKRIIAAVGGKARRVNVLMPFLYESRQHKRTRRESLDCALALQELIHMGVDNIITFDAHDPPGAEFHSSSWILKQSSLLTSLSKGFLRQNLI